ncbi:MAG: SOS response-associated peptidase [Planctomycetota bacterium]
MCGRYVVNFSWQDIDRLLAGSVGDIDLDDLADPSPNWNTAPTHEVPVLRTRDSVTRPETIAWGYQPHWSDTLLINAQAEKATGKTWGKPFRTARCVVPAGGFYEWTGPPRNKTPLYITRADGEPMLMAGLVMTTKDSTGVVVMTQKPNLEMEPVHRRMPAILEPEVCGAWLDEQNQDDESLLPLCGPVADGLLVMHQVSKRVGSVRNNDASLIEPDEPGQSGGLFGFD